MAAVLLFCVTAQNVAALTEKWMTQSLPPGQRAQHLLDSMSLDEKLKMLHGPQAPTPCCECRPDKPNYSPACAYTGNVAENTRLDIPPIHMNDGPQGFRDNIYPGTTTQFPSGLTVAASWDVASMGAWGHAMGAEFFGKGANVQLGPGLCLARLPNDGRNFEYLSGEDPFLGFTLVQPVIAGIQANKVIANAKHWVANNQETNRMTVNEIVDERTRFELYYPPFAGAVAAGVGSVMCSYNKITPGDSSTTNWSCENPVTLRHDLKQSLNFSGFVMSDWTATHSTSLPAGLDMEMPGADHMNADKVRAGISSGTITLGMVDDAVLRILTPMFAVGVMDAGASAYRADKHAANVSTPEHMLIARELTANSTVLLKNSNHLLPLTPGAKLAVIGMADAKTTIYGGSGSGSVAPSYPVTPLDALTRHAASHGGAVTFVPGSSDLAHAVKAAKSADVAVVFAGTVSGEGRDRQSLGLGANQDALVTAVASAQPNTVVFVASPGSVLLPWSTHPGVAAILANFMPGQQVGNAVVDILFGAVNPSGKLPVTFPNKDNETAFTPSQWPGVPIPPSGGYCKPHTYKVSNGGCFNDTAHQCGFSTVSASRTENSWTNAASVCNANGFNYAGAEDGLGAEVMCSMKPPSCPRVDDSYCAVKCPNNTHSGRNETCGDSWMLRLVDFTCEREVHSFCKKVCQGTTCTPELNTSYLVANMGCFNDTGPAGPNFDGACGFQRVGSGNRVNNSWQFAAQTCNQAGFAVAAVVDGLGAEIFCSNSAPTVGRNGCTRIRESEACNMTRTHDSATPWVDYPCNACNQTVCGGHRDQTCGGATGKAYDDSVRALRVIQYACSPTDSTPDDASDNMSSGINHGVDAGDSDGQLTQANYTERLLVGYRYYDAKGIGFTTGFPFGHGLSYTSFTYSDLKVTPTTVTFTLANTGKLAGAEVPQLYISFPPGAGEPPKVLRGFRKIHLAPGAATTVTFQINGGGRSAFPSTSVWDADTHGPKSVHGVFKVLVGSSSRDIRLQGTVAI